VAENNLSIISRGYDLVICKSDLDGFAKSSNSRRAIFVIMRRTCRTLNDYEMQHNAEVGLFTEPSDLNYEDLIILDRPSNDEPSLISIDLAEISPFITPEA